MDLINQSWDQTRPVFMKLSAPSMRRPPNTVSKPIREWSVQEIAKYLHKSEGPQELFDKENDPLENNNLGEDPKYAKGTLQHICVKMKQMIDDHLGRYPVKNKKVVLQ